MDTVSTTTSYRDHPSFSSTLLDEIYRSIDDQTLSSQSNACFRHDHDERRACLIQKWMEEKVSEKIGRKSAADLGRRSMRSEGESLYFNSSSSSSDSTGFSSSEGEFNGVLFKPKPIRTSVHENGEFVKRDERRLYGQGCKHEDLLQKSKHESKFVKTKSKALKIYSDLKKARQPISPGGRLATFLNSIFTTGNTKKPNTSSASAAGYGGYAEVARTHFDRKSKSANASTCSSATSFSRSCLSNNTPSSRGNLSNGLKRSVRFSSVSVIVDEGCQPCRHKSLHEDETRLQSVKSAKHSINKDLHVKLNEKTCKIEQSARNLVKDYHKKGDCEFDLIRKDENRLDDDGESDSSSDLFELENLSVIGMYRYREELPVYETTHLGTNRAIANGFLV